METNPVHQVILRPAEVCRRVGLSISRINKLARTGMFPRSFKVAGGRASGWLESEIDNWITGQAAQREMADALHVAADPAAAAAHYAEQHEALTGTVAKETAKRNSEKKAELGKLVESSRRRAGGKA